MRACPRRCCRSRNEVKTSGRSTPPQLRRTATPMKQRQGPPAAGVCVACVQASRSTIGQQWTWRTLRTCLTACVLPEQHAGLSSQRSTTPTPWRSTDMEVPLTRYHPVDRLLQNVLAAAGGAIPISTVQSAAWWLHIVSRQCRVLHLHIICALRQLNNTSMHTQHSNDKDGPCSSCRLTGRISCSTSSPDDPSP